MHSRFNGQNKSEEIYNQQQQQGWWKGFVRFHILVVGVSCVLLLFYCTRLYSTPKAKTCRVRCGRNKTSRRYSFIFCLTWNSKRRRRSSSSVLSLDVIIFFLCLTVYENEVEICKKSAVGGRDGKEHHTQHRLRRYIVLMLMWSLCWHPVTKVSVSRTASL